MEDSIVIEFNGEEYEFPANVSDDQILNFFKVMQSQAQPSNIPVIEVAGGVSPEESPAIQNGFMMGLKDPINAGAQLLPRGLAGLTSGFGMTPNPVSRFFDDEAAKVDSMVRGEESLYQDRRKAEGSEGFDWGRLGGNILNPANIAAGFRAAQGAKALGGGFLGQSVAAGAAGGALMPVTEGDSFAKEKGTQVVIGAVTSPIGGKVVEGAGRVLSPAVSEAEKAVRALGVRLTPGETLGGTWRTMEELAQNLPFTGDVVRGKRERALVDFNRGVINKMLDKIGLSLPDGLAGREAVKVANDAIEQSYDLVLSKMGYELTPDASRNILAALNNSRMVSGAERQQVTDILNEVLFTKFDGQKIDGKTLKGVQSDLRNMANNYLYGNSTASERNVGMALREVLKGFNATVRQQNPSLSSALRRIDSAYGDLDIIMRAAANSAAEGGKFSPKQYQLAVRQADATRNKRGIAKGTARNVKLADDALEVMGNYDNSTPFRRFLQGGGALTLGTGLYADPVSTGAGMLGTGALYSDMGLKTADVLLRSRPELVRQAGSALQQGAPFIGGMLSPNIRREYNRKEKEPKGK